MHIQEEEPAAAGVAADMCTHADSRVCTLLKPGHAYYALAYTFMWTIGWHWTYARRKQHGHNGNT